MKSEKSNGAICGAMAALTSLINERIFIVFLFPIKVCGTVVVFFFSWMLWATGNRAVWMGFDCLLLFLTIKEVKCRKIVKKYNYSVIDHCHFILTASHRKIQNKR